MGSPDLAAPFEGGADSAGGGDVIVLDENGVVEADAVIGDAAGCGGRLFERAQAGGGLAGVEHAAAGAGDGIGVLAGESGDAAQALEEVEGDALAFEQGAGAAADSGEDLAIDAGIAIVLEELQVIDAAAQGVDLGEQVEPGDDEGLAGQEAAGGHLGFGDAGAAGDIAGADVFFEREADDWVHDIFAS